jgi:hypothetical protein
MRTLALAHALTDRFNIGGNFEVPEPANGVIKIINHDDPRRNITINDETSLNRFFKTWNGPGWVTIRVNALSKAA